MSVHFDPRQQPVAPVSRTNGEQPIVPILKKISFGDVLEIRQENTSSWLDCFKNCFKAIWDFFQRLFSKKPAKGEEKAIKEVAADKAIKEVAADKAKEANKAQQAGDGVHPRIVPVPKLCLSRAYSDFTKPEDPLYKDFAKQDYNYAGISEEDIQDLMAAEHDCDYPKLALYLRDAFEIGLREAMIRINMVSIKYPQKNTLSPQFVMQYY